MSAKNGKPCVKCGANEWYKNGKCAPCAREGIRRWQKANPETVKKYKYRSWQNNQEKGRENARRRRQVNPEKEKERIRRWRQANPDKDAATRNRYRTRKTQAGGSYTSAEFKDLCHHYGSKCLCCGRDDVILFADHVIPVAQGGSSNIDNIQPLCQPCNSRKSSKTIDYRPGSGLGRWVQRKLFG